MTLIKSISGIRGTIGGATGENLTPLDVVRFTAAYGQWLAANNTGKLKVVTGRDARLSGSMVHQLVNQTLVGLGIDVVDLDLSTTPTVALAVAWEKASGGIIITASHNPKEWNALKLLNQNGEFIDAQAGGEVLQYAIKEKFSFAPVEKLGDITSNKSYLQKHIEACLSLPVVQSERIKQKQFKVVVDAVNSSGGIAVPLLLKALNCSIIPLHCEPTGNFSHNPEPLKAHLKDLSAAVLSHQADFGIAVDPDVDRLVFMDENGNLFGEEYTLVACADYVLRSAPGPTVSNLSSTRALAAVSAKYNQPYHASAVGEVNVVTQMKAVNAVIGGEGNGGVIYPDLHYGRDALVGIALFLSLLAEEGCSVATLKKQYPLFFMQKSKVVLPREVNVDALLAQLQSHYKTEKTTTIDGLKIDFETAWVHLRKSNTEPIVRVYTEAQSQEEATTLAEKFVIELEQLSR